MSERILFLTPCQPASTGNGLAMRAHAVLTALRQQGDVEVDVRPAKGWWRWLGPAWDWPLIAPVRRNPAITRVHVYRLSCVRWAEPYLGKVPCDLDIDESDSAFRASLSALTGDSGLAREAVFYKGQEHRWLPRFDRVFVSSAAELPRFAGVPANFVRMPNTVAAQPHRARATGERFRILYVGNLGYEPNRRAVMRLVREILPRLDDRFEIRIVGPGWNGPQLTHARLQWAGFVPDLAQEYQQADVLVVPLDAGGGTRIKVLEAMSHGVPVVSSRIGVEGLDVTDRRDVLLAEHAPEFEQWLIWLREYPDRAVAIGEAGRELVERQYLHSMLGAILDARPVAGPR